MYQRFSVMYIDILYFTTKVSFSKVCYLWGPGYVSFFMCPALSLRSTSGKKI